jgi:transcriptional regulator with XRE-family HTH domain
VALEVAKEKDATGFGVRLKALRAKAGLTQQELADRMGMAAQNINRFERGGRTPSWETVIKFAEALGVQPNDFLPEDE